MPKSTSNSGFPASGPVPSFWLGTPHQLENHRTTSDLPMQCDVLIIGSGFAGAATGYHIMKDNPNPPSIVILEARTASSGATGRNGGHVKPDTYFNVPKYTKLYGPEMAAKLANFESSQVLALKELVEKEGIECDFHLTRTIDVYLNIQNARDTETAYRELVKNKVVNLNDVAFTSKKDAARVSGVKGAECCFSFTAAHLWPAKMVQHLLGWLIQGGTNLQTNTPVIKISPTRDSKGLWQVATTRGVISASKIVFATNGYTSQLLPQYRQKIVPVRGVASRIVSPKGTNTPHLNNTYSLRFGPQSYDYLIPRTDGSIVVGGARQRFWQDKRSWFDNVNDNELIEATNGYFDGYMQKHFRGWEDSGAETEQVWTGIMGYSSDFMPHLGEIPGAEGQFIIAAFSGHGMPQILLSSKGVASMVRDNISFEETGLPGVFKTTKERIQSKKNPLVDSLYNLWNDPVKSSL